MLKESGAKPVVLSCFNGYSESFHWKRKPKLPKLPASLRSLYSPGNCELTDGEAQPISKIMFYKYTSVQSSKLKARRNNGCSHCFSQGARSIEDAGVQPVVFSCCDGYSEPFHWKRNQLVKVYIEDLT